MFRRLKFLPRIAYFILIFFNICIGFPVVVQAQISAEDFIEQAVESEKKGDINQAVFYYNKAANSYWKNSELTNAIKYFKKALKNVETIGNVNGIKAVCSNLGFIYSDLGDYQNAKENFQKAVESAENLKQKPDVAQGKINLSSALIELGELEISLKILQEALQIAQEIDNAKILRNVYYNFNKTYEKMGNVDKANEYFSLYAMLTKKIQAEEIKLREERANAIADSAKMAVKQISSEKEITAQRLTKTSEELKERTTALRQVENVTKEQKMKIDLLTTEMKLREAELARQKLLQKVYIGLIIFSLAFAGLIFWAYNEKKKANKLLWEKNAEITRQKEEISKQADELRELNALKDKLFSIIAHDLRSPLFSLIAMLNIAQEGHFTEDSFKEILGELSTNVSHTTALLENLLSWAKNQMHGTKVNLVNFDLNEIVNSRVLLLKDAANKKEIAIYNRIKDASFVYADKDMVDIVIRNLVSNAIKFCRANDKISLWSSINDGKVTICVEDTGIGISQENLKKLFLNQMNSTRGTSNEKGTGLGLILCKEFVEMNGGEIWAESQPEMGSKFFITLPVAKISKV